MSDVFCLVIVCILCLCGYVFVWQCCLSLMLFVLGFLCYLYVVVLFCLWSRFRFYCLFGFVIVDWFKLTDCFELTLCFGLVGCDVMLLFVFGSLSVGGLVNFGCLCVWFLVLGWIFFVIIIGGVLSCLFGFRSISLLLGLCFALL